MTFTQGDRGSAGECILPNSTSSIRDMVIRYAKMDMVERDVLFSDEGVAININGIVLAP